MRFIRSTWLLAVTTWVGACSLINAPDDVLLEASSGNGSGANSGTGATDSGGGDSPISTGGDDMGTAGNDMGTAGMGVGGAGLDEDPGPGPNPTTGIVVLGAKDDDGARFLSVLNARTGKTLASESLPVAAVAYDEAPDRHVWFVFTASKFPADPKGAADLEVRRWDDATNEWYVLSHTTALPPPEPDQLVILNERLVYLSHVVMGGAAVSAATILDTSDLSKVKELTTRTADDGDSYVGLVGDRGSDVSAGALGGRLRLMVAGDCNGVDCALNAQQIFVGDSVTDGNVVMLDRFVGQPRFARSRLDDKLYVAIRSTQPSSRLMIRSFTMPDLTNPMGNQITGFAGDDVGGMALTECAEAGVITDVTGNAMYAFHLVSGQFKMTDLAVAGGPLYSDAFVPSTITLDPSTAPGLRSFDVSKSGTTNVAVNERTAWVPDSTLLPYTAATRRSESFKCP